MSGFASRLSWDFMEPAQHTSEMLAGAVARLLLASADARTASEKAIYEVARELKAPAAFVVASPDGADAMELIAATGLPQWDHEAREPRFEAPARLREAARAGGGVAYVDVTELPQSDVKHGLEGAGVHGVVLVPLLARDELLGILGVAPSTSTAPNAADSAVLVDAAAVWTMWIKQRRARDRERVAVWRYCVVRDAAQQIEAGLPLHRLLRRLVDKACELVLKLGGPSHGAGLAPLQAKESEACPSRNS
jgi:transcriptional regulator with GAF, ATPase, and Fis domain